MELSRYNYSIFDYLRKYDSFWRKQIKNFLNLLTFNTKKNETKVSHKSNVSDMPDEVVFEVMKFMDFDTLMFASCVNNKWNTVSHLTDELWSNLLKHQYSLCCDAMVLKKTHVDIATNKDGCLRSQSKIVYRQMFDSYHDLRTANIMYNRMPEIPVQFLIYLSPHVCFR
jgi:hypothetical protein